MCLTLIYLGSQFLLPSVFPLKTLQASSPPQALAPGVQWIGGRPALGWASWLNHMVGLLKWGYPQLLNPLNPFEIWDFPWNEPSSHFGGTPNFGSRHIEANSYGWFSRKDHWNVRRWKRRSRWKTRIPAPRPWRTVQFLTGEINTIMARWLPGYPLVN